MAEREYSLSGAELYFTPPMAAGGNQRAARRPSIAESLGFDVSNYLSLTPTNVSNDTQSPITDYTLEDIATRPRSKYPPLYQRQQTRHWVDAARGLNALVDKMTLVYEKFEKCARTLQGMEDRCNMAVDTRLSWQP